MRGGREEDGKVMIPLFPRLHVNDAHKGGPRAPPRNKMALYEQLSVPSQRFKHAALPRMLPLSSSHNSAAPVPSASSTQVYGHERSLHSSHYSSCQTSCLTEKASLSSDAKSSSSLRQEFDRRSARHVGQELVNAPAHLQSNERGLTSSLNSSRKVYDDDDDFRVPNFNLSGKDQHASEAPAVEAEISQGSVANYNSTMGLPKDHDSHQRHPVSTDLKSKKHERSGSNQELKESVSPKVHKQNPTSTVRSGQKNAHQENATVKLDSQKILLNGERKLLDCSTCNGNWGASRCSTETGVTEDGDLSKVKIVSVSKTSNTSNPKNLDEAEDYNENEDKKSGSLGDGDMEKIEDGSDTSMVESDPGFDISPDDVVDIIGAKHFWKARRAIFNQQRVFAVQVFELHRLIKVQKLIAASPNLLLEEDPALRKSSKVQSKINSSEQNMKSQPQSTKQKDGSHNTNSVPSENKPITISHPSQDDNFNRSCANQNTKSGPHPGNPTTLTPSTEYRTNSWCLHPQGNQWLVPVMSPSEGLVYKPYMGPFPPNAGFMAPVFGGYGSMPMPPVVGDFMNAAYGFPASRQQQNFGIIPGNPAVVPHYFPAPFGLSVANPSTAGSAIEQTMLPTGHVGQQSHNSCDTPNPRMEAISDSAQKKIQASKDSEFHGSTASSPSDRTLRSLPISLAKECSDQPVRSQSKGHHTQVIKVVPHKAMLATESAARIFRCIQKERLQFD